MTFDELKAMPQEEGRAFLKTLPMEELLKLALEGISVVEKQVEELGKSMERQFEGMLAVDKPSKEATDALIAKIKK